MSIEMTAYKINWEALMKESVGIAGKAQPVHEFLKEYRPLAAGGAFDPQAVKMDQYGGAAQMLRVLIKLRTHCGSEDFYPLFCCFDKWHGDGGSSFYTFFVLCDNKIIAEHESMVREVAEAFLELQPWSAGAVALQYENFYGTTLVGRGLALSGETHHVLTAKGRHDVYVERLNAIINLLLWLTGLTAVNTVMSIFR